ncbi:MAG: MBL fold metallo-hydrolase [Chloroflexi bacterium]|nr:MBL fold metallo-hydrolase [Chloroflexota bacterium]
MQIKYLAHASFLITSGSGTKLVTDPYTTGGPIRYGEVNEAADIVTISHGHGDHSNAAGVKGNPRIVKETGTTEIKGIRFRGFPAFHDDTQGKQRGNIIIFCFAVDGMNVCHLGDLGAPLSDQQAAELGKIDVLLIPVGGHFTIDAKVASQVCDKLKPKVIIPMHFKTDKLDYPIASVEDFLSQKANVTRLHRSEADFTAGKLPTSTQIMVLEPARL